MFAVVLMLLTQAPPDPHPDYPPLSDLSLFPSHAVATEQRQRYDRHSEWLTSMQARSMPLDAERIGWWIWETEERRKTWRAIEEARATGFSESCRREALDLLKRRLGTRAYLWGAMPPRMPVVEYPEPPKVMSKVAAEE